MEGIMVSSDDAKVIASTFINVEDQAIRMEKLQLEPGQEKIRLSFLSEDNNVSGSHIISEEQLLDLLNQAIHSEVLPRNFLGKLRERIEI
jgi:hypothetical protein